MGTWTHMGQGLTEPPVSVVSHFLLPLRLAGKKALGRD